MIEETLFEGTNVSFSKEKIKFNIYNAVSMVRILQLALLCISMLSFKKKTKKNTVNFIFDLIGFTGISFSTREYTTTI